MAKKLRLNAEQRDNLVAYLDGELEPNTARDIDQVLGQSEVARHEVEQLSRTYELLDLLPTVKASDSFTERTLTTIRLDDVPRRLVDQPWFPAIRRGVLLAGWLAALVAASYLGFLATNRWAPNRSERLLRDLPVIEQLDAYTEIGDTEFLGELRKRGTLNKMAQETTTPP